MPTDDAKRFAAQRWIASRLVRVAESPGDEAVLEQPSFALLYEDYAACTLPFLRWKPWRLSQELPSWVKRYKRLVGPDAKIPTVHCACVRLKEAARQPV